MLVLGLLLVDLMSLTISLDCTLEPLYNGPIVSKLWSTKGFKVPTLCEAYLLC